MPDQQSEFVQLAAQAVRENRFEQALELASQALAIDPTSVDALVIRGIAYAQTQQSDAATAAFREAIRIDPTSSKAYYNLATHLYQLGQKQEALTMAREASRLDGSNSAAKELALLLETELNTSPSERIGSPYGAPMSQAPMGPVRVMPDTEPVHSIGFIQNLGKTWVTIGWVIAIAGLAYFLIMIPTQIKMVNLMMENLQNPDAMRAAMQKLQTPTAQALGYLGWVINLGMLIWLTLDLADRKGNWLWLIAQICCCFLLPFGSFALYLSVGRKN